MIKKGQVTVLVETGLHARPAAEFVLLVIDSAHMVFVSNSSGKRVAGESILGLMSLAVKTGETIEIEVSGPDADSVFDQLKAVVAP